MSTINVKASEAAKGLIGEEINRQLGSPLDKNLLRPLIAESIANIDAVMTSKRAMSYRDALVIQFAFGAVGPLPMNLTQRQEGGRSVAGWLGEFLTANHIPAVKDAFQNIGKNSADLVRGNFTPFDDVLKWASVASRRQAELQAALKYACASLVSRTRSISPLPTLDKSSLTYQAFCRLLVSLFQQKSGGAYEQFSVAALLHAVFEQQDVAGHRVDTKNINASDKSSRVAGDVQILVGPRLVEAIEVTANDWRSKISGAAKTIKDNDLSRLTILANGVLAAYLEMLDGVKETGLDSSVLELNSFCFDLVATLSKPGRANALNRLYELLERKQPRDDLVNGYCEMLRAMSMTEAAGL